MAVISNLLRACNYHSYPDANEVPIVKTNLSTVKKQFEKDKGPWANELLEMQKKYDITSCFPGVKETFVDAKTTAVPVPEMTQLDNGLKVVSITTPDMTMSSFCFLINSGR